METRHRAARAALAVLLSMFLLAACGGQEPAETETSPTTGDTGAFEITGTVQAVEIESGESPEASPTATGTATGTSPAAGATGTPSASLARLLVEVESINDGPAELCDVSEGDEVTLIVSPNTAIEPQTALEDLDELEGRSVTAEGNAEELAAEDQTGNPAAEQETASPTTTASPQQTGESERTPGATATPEGTGGLAGDGAEAQDPEAGCNFEVAQLTVEEEEEGTGGTGGTAGNTEGTGAGSGSPTPAPAGGNDVGGTNTPAANQTAGGMQTPSGATPTSGGSGT